MFEVLQFHSFKLVLYLNDGIEWSRSLLNLNTRGSAIALRPFYILYLFWNGQIAVTKGEFNGEGHCKI